MPSGSIANSRFGWMSEITVSQGITSPSLTVTPVIRPSWTVKPDAGDEMRISPPWLRMPAAKDSAICEPPPFSRHALWMNVPLVCAKI